MASPKNPSQQALAPKLTDPNNVQEAFANYPVGISIRDGIVHITLSVIRPRHSGVVGPSDEENVVTSRTALPLTTMNALVEAYGQLQTAMHAQQFGKPN